MTFPSELAPDEVQLLALIAFSIVSACIGPLLIYKRMTMMTNALSHTTLLGVVAVFLITGDLFATNSYFIGACLAALATSALIGFFQQKVKLQEDASIGLVFTALFALALILVTLFAKNVHLGSSFVLGSSDTLTTGNLPSIWGIAAAILLLHLLLGRHFLTATFDQAFGISLALPMGTIYWLLLIETAFAMVMGIHTFGVVAVLSCLIAPQLIVRPFVRHLSQLQIYCFASSAAAALVSVALSRYLLSSFAVSVSTGALYATLLSVAAIVSQGVLSKSSCSN